MGLRSNSMSHPPTPRLIETGYRSPQLTLWTLGTDRMAAFPKIARLCSAEKAAEEA